MKTFIKFILVFSALSQALSSCKDVVLNKPLEHDATLPGPITKPVIKNIPGGATLTYHLPADPDLLYVRAEYKDKSGKLNEVKSSYYADSLTVNGFGDTLSHEIKLYAVDRSENASAPVTVIIHPLLPPLVVVFKSLSMKADFGGVHIDFKNPYKANVAIVVSATDSMGDLSIADTYYTSLDSGSFSVRGFDSTQRQFAVYVRDQWQNRSDTISQSLKPFYEVELDKSKFRILYLKGDLDVSDASNMWDGTADDYYQSGHAPGGGPKWFTVDLGVSARLSRFNIKTVHDTRSYFADATMREYEIWGSNDPNPNGDWDNSWVKLVSYESVKPSGLPKGELSDDDIAAGDAGDDGAFPLNAPPVRYIRIKCLLNWLGPNNTDILIGEMTFWGSPQ